MQKMERKRKNSGEALLEDLRSQQGFDTSSPNEVEVVDQVDTPHLADQASDEIEFLPEEKDDPLLVDIIGEHKLFKLVILAKLLSLIF